MFKGKCLNTRQLVKISNAWCNHLISNELFKNLLPSPCSRFLWLALSVLQSIHQIFLCTSFLQWNSTRAFNNQRLNKLNPKISSVPSFYYNQYKYFVRNNLMKTEAQRRNKKLCFMLRNTTQEEHNDASKEKREQNCGRTELSHSLKKLLDGSPVFFRHQITLPKLSQHNHIDVIGVFKMLDYEACWIKIQDFTSLLTICETKRGTKSLEAEPRAAAPLAKQHFWNKIIYRKQVKNKRKKYPWTSILFRKGCTNEEMKKVSPPSNT